MTEIMTVPSPIVDVTPIHKPNVPPRCPVHHNEPQIQCGPDSKRAGQYLGACKVCMAERKVGRKANKTKEKMTPAVARDLGSGGLASMRKAVVFKDEAEAERVLGSGKVLLVKPEAVVNEIPLCKKPDCEAPGSPVKIDKLGRSMGMCQACVAARGRRIGIEAYKAQKITPPVAIPLNQAKYAELREWLVAQADENERTLQAEIIYRLKLVMREAG